jgi:hypothetical protein
VTVSQIAQHRSADTVRITDDRRQTACYFHHDDQLVAREAFAASSQTRRGLRLFVFGDAARVAAIPDR